MIYIDNRQDKIQVTEELNKTLENVINCALREEQVKVDYEVSVIFVDNETIRKINKEQRKIDRATDVLSFPMLNYTKGKVFKDEYTNKEFSEIYLDDDKLVLGDIVLSLERAEEQRKEYEHSFIRETAYLTVHSVLHLLGYDHMEEEEKKVMRKREEEILKKFNIKR